MAGNHGDLAGKPTGAPAWRTEQGKQCGPSGRVPKCYELAVNSGRLSLKGPAWLWSFSCQTLTLNLHR